MLAEFFSLAPYFRNGLLYFPEKTVRALIEVGLDSQTGYMAQHGLSLDDHRSLSELSTAIDALLLQIDSTSPFFNALTSDEAYFILTGKPISA